MEIISGGRRLGTRKMIFVLIGGFGVKLFGSSKRDSVVVPLRPLHRKLVLGGGGGGELSLLFQLSGRTGKCS